MSIFDLFQKKYSFLNEETLKGMKDRHSHILFGVDDGLQTLAESLQVLELMEKVGYSELWCTPHIMEDTPNTSEGLRARFAELKSAYKGQIILHLAAEYMLDNLFDERFKKGDLLTMEDNTLLLETSTWNPPPALYDTLRKVQAEGYRPLLAHPERYRYLNEPSYERLHEMGVHFQMNLGSLVGYYGETAMKKAQLLLENGWYSSVGTDCHRFNSLNEQLGRRVLSKATLDLIKNLKLLSYGSSK